MFNIPSLPSLGVWTPKVLKALLPRLKTYALKNKSDALLPVHKDPALCVDSLSNPCC